MDLNIPIPDDIANDVLRIPMPSANVYNKISESQLLNIPIPDMPPLTNSYVPIELDIKENVNLSVNNFITIQKETESSESLQPNCLEILAEDQAEPVAKINDSPSPAVPTRITLLGAETARRRLQAFSIQKKINALPAFNNSSPPNVSPTTPSLSSPLLIGRKIQGSIKKVSAFHKPVVDVFSEANDKKKKTARPQYKKGISEYEKSRLKLRSLETFNIFENEKFALAKIGVPLGMVPVGTIQALPMPSKAMPPLKNLLKPEEVESLIHKAKTLKEGERFQFVPKFKKDEIADKKRLDNAKFQRDYRDADNDKYSNQYKRNRSRWERDYTRRASRRQESKHRHDSSSSSGKKEAPSKETDVNMEDFVVCDSWSMDTDPSIKDDSCNDNLFDENREKVIESTKKDSEETSLQNLQEEDCVKDNISFCNDIKEKSSPHIIDCQSIPSALDFLKTSFRSDTFKSISDENIPQSPKLAEVSKNIVHLAGPSAYTSIISEIYSPPSSHGSGNDDSKSDHSNLSKLLANIDSTPKNSRSTDVVQSLKIEQSKENIFYSPGMVSSRESTPIVIPLPKPNDLIKEVSNDSIATSTKSKEKKSTKLDRLQVHTNLTDDMWKHVVFTCQPKKHSDKNCYKETTFKPVIKYAENLRYCNCPGGRLQNFEKFAVKIDEITSQGSTDHLHPSDSPTARDWYPALTYVLSDKSNIELSTNWETDDSLSQQEAIKSSTNIANQLSSLTADNLAKFDSINKPEDSAIAEDGVKNKIADKKSETPIPDKKNIATIPMPITIPLNLTSLDSEYEKFMEAVWPEVVEEANDNMKNQDSSKDSASKTTGSTISKNLDMSSNSGSFKEFFDSTVTSKPIVESNIEILNDFNDKSDLIERDNSQDTCYGMDSASVVSICAANSIKVNPESEKILEKVDNNSSVEWKKMASDGWSGESETEALKAEKSSMKTSPLSRVKHEKKRKGHAKVSSRQRKTKTAKAKKQRRQSATTSSDPDDDNSLPSNASKRSSSPSSTSSDSGSSSSSDSESSSSSSPSSSSESSLSSSNSSSESSDSSYEKKKAKEKKKRSHSKKKHRKALLKAKKMKKKLAVKAKKLKIKKKKLKLLTKKNEKEGDSEESLSQKALMVKLEKSIAKSEKRFYKAKQKEKKKQQKRKLVRKKNKEASRKKKRRHNKKKENESTSSSSDSSSSSDTEDERGLATKKSSSRKRKVSSRNEPDIDTFAKKKRAQLNSTDTNDDMDDANEEMDVSFDMETVRNIKRERVSDEEVEAPPPPDKVFSPRRKRTLHLHQIISVNELHSDFIESNRKNEDLESQNTPVVKTEPELIKLVKVIAQNITELEEIPVPTVETKTSLEITTETAPQITTELCPEIPSQIAENNINTSLPEDEESLSSSSDEGSSDSDSVKDDSVDLFHDDTNPDDDSMTNELCKSPTDETNGEIVDHYDKLPDEIDAIVRLRKPISKLSPIKTADINAAQRVEEQEESDEAAAAEELKKQFDMVENYSTPTKSVTRPQVPCDVRPIPSLSAAVPVPQATTGPMTGEIKWDWRPDVYHIHNDPKPRKPSRWGVMSKTNDITMTNSSVSTLIEVELKSETEIHLPTTQSPATTSASSPLTVDSRKNHKNLTNKSQMIPGLEDSYETNESFNDGHNDGKVYQIQTISTCVGSNTISTEVEFSEDRLEAYDENGYEMIGTEGFEGAKNEEERKASLSRRRHFQNQSKTISLDDRISLVLQRPPGTKLTNGDSEPTEITESVESEPKSEIVETSPEKGILIDAGVRIPRTDPRVLKVKRVCFADGLAPGQDSDCEENIQPPPPKKQKVTAEMRKLRKKVGGHAYPCPPDWADYHPHWDTLPPPPPPPGSPPHHLLYPKSCNIASLTAMSDSSEGLITRLPRIPSHNETVIA